MHFTNLLPQGTRWPSSYAGLDGNNADTIRVYFLNIYRFLSWRLPWRYRYGYRRSRHPTQRRTDLSTITGCGNHRSGSGWFGPARASRRCRSRLSAPRSIWDRIVNEQVDCKGRGRFIRCNLGYPFDTHPGTGRIRPVKIISYTPSTVKMTLERLTSRSIPVEIVSRGDLSVGFQSDPPVISQNTVMVTGPASIVSQVDFARAVLDITQTRINQPGLDPAIRRCERPAGKWSVAFTRPGKCVASDYPTRRLPKCGGQGFTGRQNCLGIPPDQYCRITPGGNRIFQRPAPGKRFAWLYRNCTTQPEWDQR